MSLLSPALALVPSVPAADDVFGSFGEDGDEEVEDDDDELSCCCRSSFI